MTLFEATARRTFRSVLAGRIRLKIRLIRRISFDFRHQVRIPLFVPRSSSRFQQFLGWVLGRRPEFVDPKVIAFNAGRESTNKFFSSQKKSVSFFF